MSRPNDGISAYRLSDGYWLWDYAIGYRGGGAEIYGDEGITYLILSKKIRAFDSKNGALLWEDEYPESLGQAVFDDLAVYALTSSNSFADHALTVISLRECFINNRLIEL